jgi:hypothetical protein
MSRVFVNAQTRLAHMQTVVRGALKQVQDVHFDEL